MTLQAFSLFEPQVPMHITVMKNEVVWALEPKSGGLYLDVTGGAGGHSRALLESNRAARVVTFDRDPDAIGTLRDELSEFGDRATVVRGAFSELQDWARSAGVERVDGLIGDLGISSIQLDTGDRGLSFKAEGPIDMRMDRSSGETALELIERLNQDELANVIYQLGEERRSRRVARCIKQAAERGELETTLDLRRSVVRAVGPRRVGGIDPATRTFQALRIAVNEELLELETLIAAAGELLADGAPICLISFHSLEDRIVKRAFLRKETWQRLTKKPLVATADEQRDNPRSRSAKLRVARRQPRGELE